MMRNLLWIFVLLTGCGYVPQKLDPKIYYRRDMKLKVNGMQGDGVLVVPQSDSYDFDITAQGKLDLFSLTSCHREFTKEKAGSKGIFNGPRRIKIEYTPVRMESESLACPVILAGFESKKGRHSWGMIDFENDALTLKALLSCNGSTYNTNGVSVCQAKTGLVQEIKFPVRVLVAKSDTCIELQSKDGMTFQFKMPNRECTFRFVTENGEEKWHRMTTLGYEQLLVRDQ